MTELPISDLEDRNPHASGKPPCNLQDPPAERRCGARTRSGRPCRNWTATGRSRCRLHGGASLRGMASPHYKHGAYSRDLLNLWFRSTQIRDWQVRRRAATMILQENLDRAIAEARKTARRAKRKEPEALVAFLFRDLEARCWGDRTIARKLGVSRHVVAAVRRSLEPSEVDARRWHIGRWGFVCEMGSRLPSRRDVMRTR